ncbi:MAG: flagellar protein FlaG [Nitrospirota bacterium]
MNIINPNSVKPVENPIILQKAKDVSRDVSHKDIQKSADNLEKGNTNPDINKLEKAVNNANELANYFNKHLNFSIDEATERIVVKVIDDNTGEVIRQIPPKEMLSLSAHIDKLQALLFDGKY